MRDIIYFMSHVISVSPVEFIMAEAALCLALVPEVGSLTLFVVTEQEIVVTKLFKIKSNQK